MQRRRSARLLLALFSVLALGAAGLAHDPGDPRPPRVPDTAVTRERSATKIADGVYVIRHKDAPDTFPQGNTTVIAGDRAVLVVDSCYLPSSAREDIAQIRQWTSKPVRYLVNTHWHYDHTMGNGVYAEAFPELTIVAHVETAKQMRGYNPGWFERFPKRVERFQRILDTGKDEDGKPLSDTARKEYADAIAGVGPVAAEFKSLVDRMPNLTFDGEMVLDLGNREVRIKHLGRGNTAGDAVVFLPKERILVAGDLLDHPIPYLGGGYPTELVATLREVARFDSRTIVPGHGTVLTGEYAKTYLNDVTEFVSVVVEQVGTEVYKVGNNSRTLEEVRAGVEKAIDLEAWRRKFAGDDPENREFFDGFSFPGLVRAAFAETWRR
jgi:glyoxylase-like metal-dependent hydrolase (beta-lactamase superfamily II)